MTALEGITDTAAVQGLKAVEETAIATLVAIERAYEAAMAQVADLAANRARVMAPRVIEVPRQVVVAPPAPVVEAPAAAPAEIAAEIPAEIPVEIPAEAMLEATTESPVEAPADVTVDAPEPRVSPLVEALQALQVIEARAEDTPEAQPASLAELHTEVFAQVPAEVPAEALAEVEAEVEAEAEVARLVEVVPRPRRVDVEWIAGRHAEAKTDQIPVQAA